MAMVCGAETTREDDFIYAHDVRQRIEKSLLDLQSAQENALTTSQLVEKRRTVLERLSWYAFRKGEGEE